MQANWACAFCELTFASVNTLADHLLTQHSFNALGTAAPLIGNKRLWYQKEKGIFSVACFCSKKQKIRHRGLVAPYFYAWDLQNSLFADHLEKVGGIVKHCEELRIAHALSKIEKLGAV